MKNTFTILLIYYIGSVFGCANAQNEIQSNQNRINMENSGLLISFKLSYKETSKDSNGSSITIQVFENKIVVAKNYHGFKAPENEAYEKEMNAESKLNIMDFVAKNGLNINLKETKETHGIGMAGYFHFDFYGKDTSSILINGKTNIWGSDDYVKKNWGEKYVESRTNIENIRYFSIAKSFVNLIDDL